MKTVTVKVDELEGVAVKRITRYLFPYPWKTFGDVENQRASLEAFHGPTVEVPAELMEDKA